LLGVQPARDLAQRSAGGEFGEDAVHDGGSGLVDLAVVVDGRAAGIVLADDIAQHHPPPDLPLLTPVDGGRNAGMSRCIAAPKSRLQRAPHGGEKDVADTLDLHQ
jgi:hypothetical protein